MCIIGVLRIGASPGAVLAQLHHGVQSVLVTDVVIRIEDLAAEVDLSISSPNAVLPRRDLDEPTAIRCGGSY
jgi:hypothetical protein